MNHFMLPAGSSDSGHYGWYAMELLINTLMKCGASRTTLEAKIFGDGAVIGTMTTKNVGDRNAQFVLGNLRTERIPVVSNNVLDIHARKVCFCQPAARCWSGAWHPLTLLRWPLRHKRPPNWPCRWGATVVPSICFEPLLDSQCATKNSRGRGRLRSDPRGAPQSNRRRDDRRPVPRSRPRVAPHLIAVYRP